MFFITRQKRTASLGVDAAGSPFCVDFKATIHLTLNLFKILHAGLEDLHILLAIDIHGYRSISSLGMCHLTEASAVGRGDTLDRTIGAVDIILLIHGDIAVLIRILGSDLTICEESVDPLFRCYETALTVGCGIAVGSTQCSAL